MPANAFAVGTHYRTGSVTHAATKKRSSGGGRPVLIRKNTSSKNLKRRSGCEDTGEDEDMGSWFQQFCASCDTQIVVPNSSILYCSEACRRNDMSTTPVSPTARPVDVEPAKPEPDLIPPMSPTAPRSSLVFPRHDSRVSLASAATGKSDDSSTTKRPPVHDADSEAATYLSQFHMDPVAHRPRSRRASATPSLSGSPSSTLAGSMPFTPQHTSRSLGARFITTRSVDLVTPTAAAQVPHTFGGGFREKLMFEGEDEDAPQIRYRSFDEDEDEPLTYGKRRTEKGAASSSLQQLLKDSGRGGKSEKIRGA